LSPIYRIRAEFRKLADPAKARALAGFFKTGKGEYAEGDRFYGVPVPQIRMIAAKYSGAMSLSRIQSLLKIGKHEERSCALIILVEKFKKASEADRNKIYGFYLANTRYINNWDFVDATASYIVGAYLADKPKAVLERLALSKNMWERRIAMVSTFHFIRQGEYETTLKIADMLMRDTHDLIHKATGWMLREVGKRCGEAVLEKFLKPRCQKMPRTMLRYAIERLPDSKRHWYLTLKPIDLGRGLRHQAHGYA